MLRETFIDVDLMHHMLMCSDVVSTAVGMNGTMQCPVDPPCTVHGILYGNVHILMRFMCRYDAVSGGPPRVQARAPEAVRLPVGGIQPIAVLVQLH